METLTAQQARAVADVRVLGATFARRDGLDIEDGATAGPGVPVPLRIYRPSALQDEAALPILIYFHGGGMVVGSIDTVDPHCRWLSLELGCIVVSVGYRLAPEHKFPAGFDDALTATRWVQHNAQRLRGDASRLALVGESSGGTLVAAVCMALRDGGHPIPRVQVLIYSVMDSVLEGESWDRLGEGYFLTRKKMQWFVDHYLRTPSDGLDPRASPVRARHFDRLPPALIITAGLDPLIGGAQVYAEHLRNAGVPVQYHCFEGWPHGFFYWAHTEAAQASMRLTIEAVRHHWGQRSAG